MSGSDAKSTPRLGAWNRLLGAALTGILGLWSMSPASLHADEGTLRKYGIFAGQNDGGKGLHRLLYAESDAARMRDVFLKVGSLDASHALLLKGARRDALLAALKTLGRSIEADRRAGVGTVLYFYYSGHADREGLRLGDTYLTLAELKAALRGTGSELRVVFLDACQSGAATRTKGGSHAPGFLVRVDDSEHLEGEVIVTSSASDEASQESDRLGGGFFTHHLATGLLGAADASADGQVSLDEAYQYAYHRTLFETAGSSAGLQHPGYQADLHGQGALVLTRPSQGQTILQFPKGMEGTWLVFDRNRKLFVAELLLSGQEERRLALPAGRYLVQKRENDHLLAAEVNLTRGTMRAVPTDQLTRTTFSDDFARGVTEANVRRAVGQSLELSPQVGSQSYFHVPPGPMLFPGMGLVGLRLTLNARPGPDWKLAFEVATGSLDTTLDFEAYSIPTTYSQWILGAQLLRTHTWGKSTLGLGPHLEGYYLRRSFPSSAQPYQDFGTVLPGLSLEAKERLTEGFSVGLQVRAHYLYYFSTDEDNSLGSLSFFLSADWMFRR